MTEADRHNFHLKVAAASILRLITPAPRSKRQGRGNRWASTAIQATAPDGTVTRYDSIKQAGRELGHSHGSNQVARWLDGREQDPEGRHWARASEPPAFGDTDDD
jgi:hypothetical protein